MLHKYVRLTADIAWFLLMLATVKLVILLTKIFLTFIVYPIGAAEIIIFNKTGDRTQALAAWWLFIVLMLDKVNNIYKKEIYGHQDSQ